MSPEDYFTYTEIKSQTKAWREALELAGSVKLPLAGEFDQVIFSGCGSTYYLSLAAAALYQELTGRPARAVPGGELLLNPQTVLGSATDRTLLVAISRSGTTTETVKAAEAFKAKECGRVFAITNYSSPLAELADQSVIIPAGQEESVAQTRSFASMYVAANVLCARMAGREDLLPSLHQLPDVGDRLISEYEGFAREIGANLVFDRFYFLGSGIRYGLACEINLKMKEMTLTHSEAFHFLEFRHGPMSMVNPHAVVVGLLSQQNYKHEQKVLNEMQTLGGRVIGLAETRAQLNFHSGILESTRGVLYLPVLQLLAFYRSLAKGLNPDRPNNLTSVVRLTF